MQSWRLMFKFMITLLNWVEVVSNYSNPLERSIVQSRIWVRRATTAGRFQSISILEAWKHVSNNTWNFTLLSPVGVLELEAYKKPGPTVAGRALCGFVGIPSPECRRCASRPGPQRVPHPGTNFYSWEQLCSRTSRKLSHHSLRSISPELSMSMRPNIWMASIWLSSFSSRFNSVTPYTNSSLSTALISKSTALTSKPKGLISKPTALISMSAPVDNAVVVGVPGLEHSIQQREILVQIRDRKSMLHVLPVWPRFGSKDVVLKEASVVDRILRPYRVGPSQRRSDRRPIQLHVEDLTNKPTSPSLCKKMADEMEIGTPPT
jgi:hypothetical protein